MWNLDKSVFKYIYVQVVHNRGTRPHKCERKQNLLCYCQISNICISLLRVNTN